MAGQTFGKYIVTQRLGRGGMAEVYRARHPALNRDVAIKVILPHLATEEGFTERFRREANVVAALRHPHIVQLYDFDVVNGQPFMVMEYLEGGTLKECLARHRAEGTTMPLDQAVRLLTAVAAALDYAHARGAVHRDIKPANILFTALGEPVLSDFGVAKILWESAQFSTGGAVIGTPAYMSPEQATSKPVDACSDLYSLGIVLYEMVTGRVPFEGDSPTAVMLQHLTTPPPPPRQFNPNISEPMQEVILQALAKNPRERFQSGDALAREFNSATRSAVSTPAQAVSAQVPTVLEKATAPSIVRSQAPAAAPQLPAKLASLPAPPKTPAVRPRRLVKNLAVMLVVALVGLLLAGVLTGVLLLSGFLRVSVAPAQPTRIAQGTVVRLPSPTTVIAPAASTLTPRATPSPTSSLAVGTFGSITFAPGYLGVDPNIKPVDPATRYPEGITKVYALAPYTGTIRGEQWRYERYLDGKLQDKLSGAGWNLVGPGTVWVNVWNSDGLTPGDWEFRLYIADQVVQKGTFTIDKAKPGAAFFGVIRFAEGIKDDKPLNAHRPIDNFKAKTTQVYAFFDAANMTKQSNWKWQWYREGILMENTGGAKTWIGGQTEKDWWLRLTNDDGLTPGTYELKLYIDEKLAQLGTFVIEP